MARLHEAKQKHLKEMVLMGEIPLRTGGLFANHASSLFITHVACCIVLQSASVQEEWLSCCCAVLQLPAWAKADLKHSMYGMQGQRTLCSRH